MPTEPTPSEMANQLAALTRDAADLRRELAAMKAELRKLNPPPDGWRASLNWYAADGSGRWVAVDVVRGDCVYGPMGAGTPLLRAGSPYDAAKLCDALPKKVPDAP